MIKCVAITQARTGSERTPDKVLRLVGEKKILEVHMERVLQSKKIHQLIVATTKNSVDDRIVAIAQKYNVTYSRGSENDVLDRFYKAVYLENPQYVIRLTSDCPLIDPALIDKVIDFTLTHNYDYVSTMLNPSYPDGQCVEVFKFSALEKTWRESVLQSEREHVTPYIYKNSDIFRVKNFTEGYLYGDLRMTVDYEDDLDVINFLVAKLGYNANWLDYTQLLLESPEIRRLNSQYKRNHRYSEQIKQENYDTVCSYTSKKS